MKRSIVIAVVLGLLGVLVFSGAALAFDPQPEPPGIISKIEYEMSAGVTKFTFAMLFPVKAEGIMPFGRLAVRSFDPQPEPPGRDAGR